MADIHIDSCKVVNGKNQVRALFHISVGSPSVEEEHSQTILLESKVTITGIIEQKLKNAYLSKKTTRLAEYEQEHKFDGMIIEDASA